MKIRTKVKAGGIWENHNQNQPAGMRVRTRVKAGLIATNHNQA